MIMVEPTTEETPNVVASIEETVKEEIVALLPNMVLTSIEDALKDEIVSTLVFMVEPAIVQTFTLLTSMVEPDREDNPTTFV